MVLAVPELFNPFAQTPVNLDWPRFFGIDAFEPKEVLDVTCRVVTNLWNDIKRCWLEFWCNFGVTFILVYIYSCMLPSIACSDKECMHLTYECNSWPPYVGLLSISCHHVDDGEAREITSIGELSHASRGVKRGNNHFPTTSTKTSFKINGPLPGYLKSIRPLTLASIID